VAKKEPTVSWQVLLDDAHWEQEAAAPTTQSESARPRIRWVPQRRWVVLGALLLAVAIGAAGVFFWQRAQNGLAAMQQEIQDAVVLGESPQARQNPFLAAALLDPKADPAWRAAIVDGLIQDISLAPVATVQRVELAEGSALAHLLITDPDFPLPSRVVRFYRDDGAGWLRTTPVSSFWGPAETWEGEHFLFRYYQRDRAAVLAAGPRMEAVYLQMRRELGLAILPVRRVVVVDPDDQPPTFDPSTGSGHRFPTGELRHPSPFLLPLPVGIAEESALYRSLIAYLVGELVRESFDRYAYGEAWMWSNLTESALRNWLLLKNGAVEMDLRILIPWLLDGEAQMARQLPDGLAAECQLLDGLAMQVLLLSCTPDIHASLPSRFPVTRLSRLITTYDFDFTRDASASTNPSGPMWRTETRREIVVATTVFLYAAETYGVERLPALLEALGDYRSWLEILPAAYGVTAEEFEEGWRQWLAQEFGVGSEATR